MVMLWRALRLGLGLGLHAALYFTKGVLLMRVKSGPAGFDTIECVFNKGGEGDAAR